MSRKKSKKLKNLVTKSSRNEKNNEDLCKIIIIELDKVLHFKKSKFMRKLSYSKKIVILAIFCSVYRIGFSEKHLKNF